MITLVKLTKEVTHLSQNRAVRYESTTAVRWPHFAHDKENPSSLLTKSSSNNVFNFLKF